MGQVDVVLLTKNSEHMLCKCLTSIYENLPVKNLIVIDGFSTDRTLQILDVFNKAHGNIALFQVDGSRAKARTEGIRHVTTEWFLFIDSDVVLCKDWYKKTQADVAGGAAVVWGLNVDVIPNVQDKRVLRLQGILARECFKLRGGTHDTLISNQGSHGHKDPRTPAHLRRRLHHQTHKRTGLQSFSCIRSLLPPLQAADQLERKNWVLTSHKRIQMRLSLLAPVPVHALLSSLPAQLDLPSTPQLV